MNNILAVFIGGGLGSLLRYAIAVIMRNNFTSAFPLATLFANVLSCIVLALTLGFFADKIANNDFLKLFLLVGFCGGFSTFSTFSFETVDLLKSGHLIYALLNIVLSIISCFCIVYFLVRK